MRRWQPLKGIRILSFELAFALPAGTRALHDLGAEVVRVVPPTRRVDLTVGILDGVFQGKSCISVDLTHEEGRDIAQKLAAKADVVCSNFRPQVLQKYGLGASVLRKRHPELITLQLSGYGTPGPYANYPAFGPSTEAAGGLNRLLVDEGEVPVRVGSAVFSDQLAGRYAALSIISALARRQETGQGQAIDLSMTSGISHMLGQPITEALRTGRMPAASRNRDRRFVPQGAYRCQGADEWIAISIASDQQWPKLFDVLLESGAEMLGIKRDANSEERWQQHDQIDALLSVFCAGHNKDALAQRFQALGIPAAPVRTSRDQSDDPNVKSRSMLQTVKHTVPVHGRLEAMHPRLPWRVVGLAPRRLKTHHQPGQDNFTVLTKWLQLDRGVVRALESRGVLGKPFENSSVHT